MVRKIKAWWNKIIMIKKKRKEAKARKEMYKYLILGDKFIQWVQHDLKNQKEGLNRHQRRRFEKTLVKGEITEEMVKYYLKHAEEMVDRIENFLNPPKAGQVKVNGKRL